MDEIRKSISNIKGVGAKTEKILNDMGIFSYYDLLTYFPKGYDFFRGLVTVPKIIMEEDNFLKVKISSEPKLQYYGKMSVLKFYVVDQSGSHLQITYFRQPYLAKQMKLGRVLILKGRPYWKKGELHLNNPAIISEEEIAELASTPLVARYTVRKGMSEKKLRQFIAQVLEEISLILPQQDYIKEELRNKYQLLSLSQAYIQMHIPKTKEEAEQARRRLVFDEFYFFQRSMVKEEEEVENNFLIQKAEMAKSYIKDLPFQLTEDQLKTIQDIENDFRGSNRMVRLVQGDVGSGKTAVAFISALMMIENGYQVALMAPTEVLARQHYLEAEKNLSQIRAVLLLGSMTAKEKKKIYQQMESGAVDFIIGTHSLIQEKAEYHNLGLVITDEQHRFGVMQRENLSQKGEKSPHILVMSATPIPRTLALILYQDMDISVIQSMPQNRLPIKSFLRDSSSRQRIYQFIDKEIKTGASAYIICPAIEDNEELELTGVISYAESFQQKYPDLRVASLYGGQEDKEEIMAKFVKGNLDVLISTTVIEVGVNVPRATVMLIENADRFGLAQLHQLRGRVGRGDRQSYCIFLSDSKNEAVREKLKYVAGHQSGFDIAEYDLKMRGPGDAFGVKQHGMPMLQLADLYKDLPILEVVQLVSNQIEDSKYLQEMMQLYMKDNRKIFSI